MTIPLLRFLQLQLSSAAGRLVMGLAITLCAASAIGSHSRGALLGISAKAVETRVYRAKQRLREALSDLDISG